MKLPDWPTVVHDHNELVEGIGWVLDWLETFPGTAGTTGGSRPARTPTRTRGS